MLFRTNFDLDRTVFLTFHYRQMFLHERLLGRWDEFLHLLTAADDFYTAVNEFDNDISASCAEEEFCCHNTSVLIC